MSPLGQTVFMRSALWQNGDKTIVAIVSGVDDVSEIELDGADFIVSVTAFPPGLPSRILQFVPLFSKEPETGAFPVAWLKK